MPTTATNSPARERGFGLVEILVVLIIIAILMGALVTQLRSSKQATYYKSGAGVASSYADAVEAYMVDNGQTAPAIGTQQWPTAKKTRGPLNMLLLDVAGATGRPYMRSIPEAVTNGGVSFQGSSPNSPALVTYERPDDRTYRFVVRLKDDPSRTCAISNAPLEPAERC